MRRGAVGGRSFDMAVAGSIRDRIGSPGTAGRGRGRGRGGIAARTGGGIAGRIGGTAIAARLGKSGVKARLGVLKRNTVNSGPITDARQKINLKRVAKGRVSDARQKIEMKQRQKPVALSTARARGLKTKMTGKLPSNLKITADVSPPRRPIHMPMQRQMQPGPPPDHYFVPQQSHSEGYFAHNPPMDYMAGQYPSAPAPAIFRSAMNDAFGIPHLQPSHVHPRYEPAPRPVTRSMSPGGIHLTRTISNPAAGYSRGTGGGGYDRDRPLTTKTSPSVHYNRSFLSRGSQRERDYEAMDEDEPRRISSSVQSRLDYTNRCKIQVSNLRPSVTSDDITELFSDIGPILSGRMTSTGHAEVVYARKEDALKAIEAYHNRLLDGSPMRVFIEGPSGSTLKSATGASVKLPKGSSSIKIQPDISAIHKVLFNPSSSATRGLFKSGH